MTQRRFNGYIADWMNIKEVKKTKKKEKTKKTHTHKKKEAHTSKKEPMFTELLKKKGKKKERISLKAREAVRCHTAPQANTDTRVSPMISGVPP